MIFCKQYTAWAINYQYDQNLRTKEHTLPVDVATSGLIAGFVVVFCYAEHAFASYAGTTLGAETTKCLERFFSAASNNDNAGSG